jgi:hypothetical protein
MMAYSDAGRYKDVDPVLQAHTRNEILLTILNLKARRLRYDGNRI